MKGLRLKGCIHRATLAGCPSRKGLEKKEWKGVWGHHWEGYTAGTYSRCMAPVAVFKCGSD